MKRLSLLLIFLILNYPVLAAEVPDEGPADATATSAPAADADQDPLLAEAAAAAAAPASPAPSEDTFTPTVQISEDLSVSFPVDI